jgi:hypothetical protein
VQGDVGGQAFLAQAHGQGHACSGRHRREALDASSRHIGGDLASHADQYTRRVRTALPVLAVQATEVPSQANVEKGWQGSLQDTRLVCDALFARVHDVSLERPRLTQVEREAIRQRLQQRFPAPGALAAGQDSLRASIGLLKQCLLE